MDTNVFVATRDFNDTTHKKALELTGFLAENKVAWYTSSEIVGETLTVLSQKLGKEIAIDWCKDFIKSGIKVLFIDEIIYKDSQNYFIKTKQKNISFIDCSCVVTMKKNKIDTIFSFDKDFKKMGVKLLEDVV